MPQFTSGQSVTLQPGAPLLALNNENLAGGAATEAFVAPASTGPSRLLTVINNTASAIVLQASSDGVNFFASYYLGGSNNIGAGAVANSWPITAGVIYRIVNNGAAIVGGTIAAIWG